MGENWYKYLIEIFNRRVVVMNKGSLNKVVLAAGIVSVAVSLWDLAICVKKLKKAGAQNILDFSEELELEKLKTEQVQQECQDAINVSHANLDKAKQEYEEFLKELAIRKEKIAKLNKQIALTTDFDEKIKLLREVQKI